MQLSPHFADAELGVAGCGPEIVASAVELCTNVLEPVRGKFGEMILSDGYRDAAHNARVGGASDSQHLYLGQNSAADVVRFGTTDLRAVFDWMRQDSHIQFDQMILEMRPGTGIPRCIHFSYNSGLAKQRREALIGETNGVGGYIPVIVNP